MATLAQTITTAGGTLPKLQKKVQGTVQKGFQTSCEEWGLVGRLKQFNLNFSAREVTTPIDIAKQGGGAFIPEGGYESNPRTVAPQELTFTWVNYNDRFNITLTAKYIDQKNRDVQIMRQLKYQAMKLAEGMANRVGFTFYGYSNGVVCLTSTNATSAGPADYTLIDAFGESTLDNAAYLGSMFAAGDRVALIRAGALVANAIGTVNSVNVATPSINVTWLGSVDADANDAIVFANSVENTTIAGTDYNQSPSGLFDFTKTTSIEGLSGGTYPNWTASQDTTGSRFSSPRLMKAKDEIANRGGGDADLLIWAQGVRRDVVSAERGGLRFDDPFGLELDGAVKTKGLKQFTSRKVPNGAAWIVDSGSLFKWTLRDLPAESGPAIDGFDDMGFDKIADRNALVYSYDLPYNFVVTNRANIYYFQGLTEQ